MATESIRNGGRSHPPDSALSISPLASGTEAANTPQDFHWLAQNVPCRAACPAGTDIPGYLEAVYHGRFDDAYRINLRDNVFPGVLGRVCSRPCEDACRHGWEGNGESVAICFSKRSAADLATAPPAVLPPLFPPTGKRIVVIGAGVAGLAAARDLALFGHAVTVLEKHARPGGMLNQGIPAFRLPRSVIDREIGQVIAQGVELRCGVAVGTDVPLAELVAAYDAVVMAAGTLSPTVIPVPGTGLGGVEHGLDFLLQVNEHERRRVGKRTVVIGGGYTAMDCARTALRLGSDVTVAYRRGRTDMVVLPGELEEFLAEGGALVNAAAPLSIGGAQGAADAAWFERTRPLAADAAGRRGFEVIPGSRFAIDGDQVVLATGQRPDTSWIDAVLASALVGADGWLRSNAGQRTSMAKVFVAGDFAQGATTLISAIGHARECARQVDRFLAGRERLAAGIVVGPAGFSKRGGATTGRTPAQNVIPIHPMPVLAASARGLADEVETGFASPVAEEAASRCYLCHYKFEIIDSRCVLCDECLKVKPVPGCIVEITGLLRDDDGRITGYLPIEPGASDSLYYNRLWIDQNQCIRCGQCEAVCPVNAITLQKVTPLELAIG